jgi:hypothetical protein
MQDGIAISKDLRTVIQHFKRVAQRRSPDRKHSWEIGGLPARLSKVGVRVLIIGGLMHMTAKRVEAE